MQSFYFRELVTPSLTCTVPTNEMMELMVPRNVVTISAVIGSSQTRLSSSLARRYRRGSWSSSPDSLLGRMQSARSLVVGK